MDIVRKQRVQLNFGREDHVVLFALFTFHRLEGSHLQYMAELLGGVTIPTILSGALSALRTAYNLYDVTKWRREQVKIILSRCEDLVTQTALRIQDHADLSEDIITGAERIQSYVLFPPFRRRCTNSPPTKRLWICERSCREPQQEGFYVVLIECRQDRYSSTTVEGQDTRCIHHFCGEAIAVWICNKMTYINRSFVHSLMQRLSKAISYGPR